MSEETPKVEETSKVEVKPKKSQVTHTTLSKKFSKMLSFAKQRSPEKKTISDIGTDLFSIIGSKSVMTVIATVYKQKSSKIEKITSQLSSMDKSKPKYAELTAELEKEKAFLSELHFNKLAEYFVSQQEYLKSQNATTSFADYL